MILLGVWSMAPKKEEVNARIKEIRQRITAANAPKRDLIELARKLDDIAPRTANDDPNHRVGEEHPCNPAHEYACPSASVTYVTGTLVAAVRNESVVAASGLSGPMASKTMPICTEKAMA
jgi:hypothetical protein